jgi:ribosomal-protein-serine acetyltransferase
MDTRKQQILLDLPEELRGERVLIRPYRAGDGGPLWEAVAESREHIRPWLPWEDKHTKPDDSEAFVRRSQAQWILREDLPMGIWQQETGRYLGGTGLHRIRWEVPSFEIGYWLRASAEGKGYMTETVRLLCALAFDTLEAQRVEIRCDTRNVRSAAIPRRLGFLLEATLHHQGRDTAGELCDSFIFAMTPEQYRNVRV